MASDGIAIGGFMGTGKSTVGRRLADWLQLPFVDTDAVLEERHGPIAAQIAAGEPAFRERERALVAELCDGEARVVATGGGMWADPGSRARLRAAYRTAVLTAPLEVLRARVGAGEGRPLWAQAGRLLADRAAAYADADAIVDASTAPELVAGEVLARLGFRRTVPVALGDRSYRVILDPGGLDGLGEAVAARRAIVVTDSTVAPLWADAAEASLRGAGAEVARIVFPAGEIHKDLATWQRVVDELLELRADRGTPVIALGGGVVGDLAGFAAATVMRGLPLVQVPTTLLAMVDSSVGGKTAVNHRRGKNLVGAFHQPSLVFAPMGTLSTLPDRERRSGLGEVVKTALLGDAELLDRLEADADRLRDGDPGALAPVVARCVAIKAGIVAQDERENGLRAVLNLGHTVGHGLEAALGYEGLLHGEAVALGLVAEARWAVRSGHCADPALPDRLLRLLARLGLPSAPPAFPAGAALEAMRLDKKAAGGNLSMPVPVRAGVAAVVRVQASALPELLAELG
jgi:shikimate kinase/3-dehydroquinate synthase